MKPIIIKRDSLWYHFFKNYTPLTMWNSKSDICCLFRNAIAGVIFIAAVVFFAVMFLTLLILFPALYLLVFGLVYNPDEFGVFAAPIMSTVIIVGTCLLHMYTERDKKSVAPGLVKQAYDSWKGKYCVPVEFTGPYTDETF